MPFMDEIAEFVGGAMDGRTIATSDPAPQIIRVPIAVNLSLAKITARPSPKPPTLEIEDYVKVGRNDHGHVRYMLRR
jgi:hypothetical protein